MARVKVTQARIVVQLMDIYGHRLPSQKGLWDTIIGAEGECPKCSAPEPPKVECDTPECHGVDIESWWRYCPRCGAALTAEEA